MPGFRPDRLAGRRRALDLSRAELGRLLLSGHPASAIADLETGRAQPTPVTVLGLARVLGCMPADLFSDEDTLLAAAIALRHRIERADAAAGDIPDEVLDRLRQLLPRRDPPTTGRAAAS
jgi:transcriptional regulator with XRE-family HTH domain